MKPKDRCELFDLLSHFIDGEPVPIGDVCRIWERLGRDVPDELLDQQGPLLLKELRRHRVAVRHERRPE